MVGKRRRRRFDNIKMYSKEIGWQGVDWIYLVQDRNRRAVEHYNVRSGSLKLSACLEYLRNCLLLKKDCSRCI